MKGKPSKVSSFLSMIMGICFIYIGYRKFLQYSNGVFTYVWIGGVIVLTVLSAYNFFSKKGLSLWVFDNHSNNDPKVDFDSKLRKIRKLRDDKLISEDEYNKKREEIMSEKW